MLLMIVVTMLGHVIWRGWASGVSLFVRAYIRFMLRLVVILVSRGLRVF